jgi:hypothetical protein
MQLPGRKRAAEIEPIKITLSSQMNIALSVTWLVGKQHLQRKQFVGMRKRRQLLFKIP